MTSTRPSIHPVAQRPREDWGLFGPDSPTWRVWSSPTALIAFQRSIVVESFDPFLAAAVHDQNGVRNYATRRFDRTIQYFLTVACGDSRAAIEASEILMRVHARATGIEPVSGRPYSANDPASQLWIHVTGWQSNLLCYERYGGGRLSATDEARYWQECAIAAELQTCKPADVPRSRAEVRAYYAAMRPRLCLSDRSRALIRYFLHSTRTVAGTGLWIGSHLMARSTIATIPRWMRQLGGFDQPAWMDAAVLPATQAAVAFARQPAVARTVLKNMAPSALPVMNQVLRKEQPLRDEVLSPAEARERFGAQVKARA
ncbi:MAG TPA: oxygenase MpaB family protein [Nevskiaceae bacterium]|nr:oxygenase MpaB family protein [Nevskiaceae bacterium]